MPHALWQLLRLMYTRRTRGAMRYAVTSCDGVHCGAVRRRIAVRSCHVSERVIPLHSAS